MTTPNQISPHEDLLWGIAGNTFTGLPAEGDEAAEAPEMDATVRAELFGRAGLALAGASEHLPDLAEADLRRHRRVLTSLEAGQEPASRLPRDLDTGERPGNDEVVMDLGRVLRSLSKQFGAASAAAALAKALSAQAGAALTASAEAVATAPAMSPTEPAERLAFNPLRGYWSPAEQTYIDYDSLDDAAVTRLVAAGNEPAYLHLWRRHHAFFMNVASSYVPGNWISTSRRELIEDGLTEAFVAMHTGIVNGQFQADEAGAFKGWAARVVRNQAVNVMRLAGRWRETITDDIVGVERMMASPYDEDPVTADDHTDDIHPTVWATPAHVAVANALMADMTDREHTVFMHYMVGDESAEEVAQRLGSSPGAVRVQAHRLRPMLAAEGAARVTEVSGSVPGRPLEPWQCRLRPDEATQFMLDHLQRAWPKLRLSQALWISRYSLNRATAAEVGQATGISPDNVERYFGQFRQVGNEALLAERLLPHTTNQLTRRTMAGVLSGRLKLHQAAEILDIKVAAASHQVTRLRRILSAEDVTAQPRSA